ncbi:MAG: hypothetical protein ACK587_14100 [Cyanobacteriota bacterium]
MNKDTHPSKDNQEFLLTNATCAPADIRYLTDLSLLNEAREVTERLIDAMHPHVRERFSLEPCIYRQGAKQKFLAVAKKNRLCVFNINIAPKQQFNHLERSLSAIDALMACGVWLLPAGKHRFRKLLAVSELVRQRKILYHLSSRSIPDRITNLTQAYIRPIVRGKSRCNVEFGAEISISVTGDVSTFLDQLSFKPYN